MKRETKTTNKKRMARRIEAPLMALADALLTSPAPAGLGWNCDAVFSNPNFEANPDAPKLIRCRHTATRRMVIVGHRRRTVKRCEEHAHKLRARAEAGLVKIESDEPIERRK